LPSCKLPGNFLQEQPQLHCAVADTASQQQLFALKQLQRLHFHSCQLLGVQLLLLLLLLLLLSCTRQPPAAHQEAPPANS
jgi:hypothetical protein